MCDFNVRAICRGRYGDRICWMSDTMSDSSVKEKKRWIKKQFFLFSSIRKSEILGSGIQLYCLRKYTFFYSV
jgi:hypothetical protein